MLIKLASNLVVNSDLICTMKTVTTNVNGGKEYHIVVSMKNREQFKLSGKSLEECNDKLTYIVESLS